jgi:hypothetical protein
MKKAKTKKNSWVAWSEDEVKLLKRLYPLGGAREIAFNICSMRKAYYET